MTENLNTVSKTLIFGREPAALIATVQSVLALLLGFGLLAPIGLESDTDVAVVVGVVAALSALYLAYTTSETLLAPVLEALKAVLALGAIYGLSISSEQTGLLIAAVTAGFGLYQRDRVTPLEHPSLSSFPVVEVEEGGANLETDDGPEHPRLLDDEDLESNLPEPWDDDVDNLPITHFHDDGDPKPKTLTGGPE